VSGSKKKNAIGLTERQTDILRTFTTLGDSKLVAATMDMSPKTVDEHLRRITKNLRVRNKVQAAVKWDRMQREAA
jgi:DNA-binding CsgD family transcriptional regulator